MPTFVTAGDRQVLAGGSLSLLKRSSVPFSLFPAGTINTVGGRSLSYQELYETQIWVAAAVNVLSQEVARLPLKVYKMNAAGERERIRDHPLARLLQFPYRRASATTLKQKMMHPALLHGNSCLWKKRPSAGATPSDLLPLDWRYLTPKTDEAGTILYWECNQSARPGRIAPQDVVHMAWEGGRGDVGVSPLSYLGNTLRVEDATQRHQAASFENGVRSSGAFVIPAETRTKKEDRDELRAHIAQRYSGVDNAGKPLLLFNGATWQDTQQTAVEAELIEQRKLNREEVAAAYKIPPPMIGILDKATYSNIETQKDMFYGMVLGPWLTLGEETLQAQLIEDEWPGEGLFVEYDLKEVLRGDPLKEAQAVDLRISSGTMTPNQGLRTFNEPPSDQPGMDSYYLRANNLQPVGSTKTPDAPVSPAKMIERHLTRAADRLRDKGDPGIERFERELAEDLGDPKAAQEWAAKVAGAPFEEAIRFLIPA